MLDYHLDRTAGILSVEPKAPLEAEDFKVLTTDVDGYVTSHENLTGLLLSVAHFPGWESFAALFEHMRFVRDHHKRIARVAVVTDNPLLKIPPAIAAHFAHPEFRVFASDDRAGGLAWLKGAQV